MPERNSSIAFIIFCCFLGFPDRVSHYNRLKKSVFLKKDLFVKCFFCCCSGFLRFPWQPRRVQEANRQDRKVLQKVSLTGCRQEYKHHLKGTTNGVMKTNTNINRWYKLCILQKVSLPDCRLKYRQHKWRQTNNHTYFLVKQIQMISSFILGIVCIVCYVRG